MKKLLSKAKTLTHLQDSSSSSQNPPSESRNPSTIQPLSPADVFRYRYTHGVNLGSVFVLEEWLSPSMFPPSSHGASELDAVLSSVSSLGLEATRHRWEAHWRDSVTDEDFEWLVKEAKCNGVRIPVGFFTLGREWCVGTAFGEVGEVYRGAWGAVRRVVGMARRWGVGVLLDFHAVYGGANADVHSGTGSGQAGLWGNKENLERTRKALGWMAGELKGVENLIGIEVVNEATWGAEGIWEWYESVIEEIGAVDRDIPVYISDGWDLEKALDWCGKRRGRGKGNPVIVDTHRYYTFSEHDRSQSPQEIIARIPGELGELNGKEGNLAARGEAQVVVGEWSCVLDSRTWGRVRSEERSGLVKEFGLAQSKRWQQRAGGSYFWTWKMDWMDGGEWGFVEQTKNGNVVPPSFLTLQVHEVKSRAQAAQVRRQNLASEARHSHEDYWNRTCSEKKFEHDLYSEGWDVGFSDAMGFFSMKAAGAFGEKAAGEGCDKIGLFENWVEKRLLESGKSGEFIWEWEQGFRKGVNAFYEWTGI